VKWGKGWEVGVHKAINAHERAIRQAEQILINECGLRHKQGEHSLCPICRCHRKVTSSNVSGGAK
jgi:hypothetical protein